MSENREAILLTMVALYGVGAIVGLIVGQRYSRLGTYGALAFSVLAGLMGFGLSVAYWARPMGENQVLLRLMDGLPNFPSLKLTFFVDRLSAFFLLLTSFFATLVGIYSFSWLTGKLAPHRIAGVYNLFVAAAVLVVVVDNVYLYLVALECLSLAFSYLTLYRHDLLLWQGKGNESVEMVQARQAFMSYLIFSHIGAILVTAALILLSLAHGTVDFGAIRSSTKPIAVHTADAIFILAMAGFGIKMAAFPFQSWMAMTHPYLPTSVHALVSAVIIKVAGIYGFLRVIFEFVQPVQAWWGWLVLSIAGLTALAGVFYAMVSRDLKTTLANHSVENIGIILGGIGVGILFSAQDVTGGVYPALASLGLVAALYHLLNHAVFKSLLFLGAGAIENRTDTVSLDQLGGLLQRYRWTATAFLVGAVSIAGFPPFNGFASEWLTLQALFAGLSQDQNAHSLSGVPLLAAVLMLSLAFGLTALAFVKIAGEVLLGKSRNDPIARKAKNGDVPWPMRGPMVLLAAACLFLGILPGLVVQYLALIASDLSGSGSAQVISGVTNLSVQVGIPDAGYAAQVNVEPLLLLVAMPVVLAILVGKKQAERPIDAPWNCGTPYHAQAMQISGGAFTSLVWGWAGRRILRSQAMPCDARQASKIIPWRLGLSADFHVIEFFRRWMDSAVAHLLTVSSIFGEWFQGGDIRQYLSYLFAVFLLALAVSLLLRF